MDIRPIRTKEDYEQALEEIERLFDAEPGTPEEDKLEILSILADEYEKENHPMPLPDPIEAIKYWMETGGHTRQDLEPYIGSRARVAEILNRKRPLTLRMIRNLEKGLGLPADILVREYPLATELEPGGWAEWKLDHTFEFHRVIFDDVKLQDWSSNPTPDRLEELVDNLALQVSRLRYEIQSQGTGNASAAIGDWPRRDDQSTGAVSESSDVVGALPHPADELFASMDVKRAETREVQS